MLYNWYISISIIPKLNEARGDKFNNKFTDDIRSHIINIICLYIFSYIFLFCQYFLKDIWNKLYNYCKRTNHKEFTLPYKKGETSFKINNNYKINHTNNYTTSINYINTNTIRARKESEQARTTINLIVLLSNVLLPQICENI